MIAVSTIDNAIGLALAVAAAVYLVVVLVFPDQF